jgi:hypothetical protein
VRLHDGAQVLDRRIADVEALVVDLGQTSGRVLDEDLDVDPRAVPASAVELRAERRAGVAGGDEDEGLAVGDEERCADEGRALGLGRADRPAARATRRDR